MARRKSHSPAISGSSERDLDRMEGEDDLRTLGRAQEIRTDKKRIQRAQRLISKQARMLQATARSLGGGKR